VLEIETTLATAAVLAIEAAPEIELA